MKSILAFFSLGALAISSAATVGCANKLKPSRPGPVDPAGGGAGALPTAFVNPPYRAQDTINVTGQTPLDKRGKVSGPAKTGSGSRVGQAYSK